MKPVDLIACPHATPRVAGRFLCSLAGAIVPAAICRRCQAEWTDAAPPTDIAMTSTLATVAALVKPPGDRDGQVNRSASMPTANPPRTAPARRRPPQCDHSGKRIRKGPTCSTSEYECEIHGTATCETCEGNAAKGIPRCNDFVPIGSLTKG